MEKMKIGVIGCGNISEIYLKNLTEVFKNTEVIAVTDIVRERAEERAKQFGISRIAASNEEMLHMEDIDIVVILTNPDQHYPICKEALLLGKNVYMEKPLALDLAQGKELVELAKSRKLRLCCAPDTLLGANVQTVRKLIDDGWIGRPVGCHAHLLYPGSESWHPNPEFLYKQGAGPLFDIGPYYCAGISYLLGCVTDVKAMGQISFPQRKITSQPLYGRMIDVEVPTFLSCSMKTEKEVLVNMILTFDAQDTNFGAFKMEIYGDEGTITMDAPPFFDGNIKYKKKGGEEWTEIPAMFCYKENSRGVGVADLASAMINERDHRLSSDLAYHTLEIMDSVLKSCESGQMIHLNSKYQRSDALPLGLDLGEMD